MSVFESIERYPVDYLPSGDKALLIAWAVLATSVGEVTQNEISAVLCLEDGRVVRAGLDEMKFDYRYDNKNQTWVDVSKILFEPTGEGDHADTDPKDGDDGSPSVP